jgi:hypothetical protein
VLKADNACIRDGANARVALRRARLGRRSSVGASVGSAGEKLKVRRLLYAAGKHVPLDVDATATAVGDEFEIEATALVIVSRSGSYRPRTACWRIALLQRSRMARPGLEPGTPRFSDSCAQRSNARETPARTRVSGGVGSNVQVRKSHEIVRSVGHGRPRVSYWPGCGHAPARARREARWSCRNSQDGWNG